MTGISCIQSIVGKVPANMVQITEKEMSSARLLMRGVWNIPGKGIFHIFQGGQAARLELKRVSVYRNGEGSVAYETKDGTVKCGGDVHWRTSRGRIIIGLATWKAWEAEGQEIFRKATVKEGVPFSIRRDWFNGIAAGAAVIIITLMVWWIHTIKAEEKTAIAGATVVTTESGLVVNSSEGGFTVKVTPSTVTLEGVSGKLTGVIWSSSGGSPLEYEARKFFQGFIDSGKGLQALRGKDLEVKETQFSVINSRYELKKLVLSY